MSCPKNLLAFLVTVCMPAPLGTAAVSETQTPEPARSVCVVPPEHRPAMTANAARILRREISERCGASLVEAGEADLRIELSVRGGIGEEGFAIEDAGPGVVRVASNDARGLLYGVGKFLRGARYTSETFAPGAWRGTSLPEKRVRGIYLATHFHNFYHDAPVEKVERYVEELALWGYNTLVVWYDMHHFDGYDDPRAEAFRGRLRRILGAARRIGLDVGLPVVANEGYHNSPEHLRADVSGMRGAKFPSDVCASAPGGADYVLGNFARTFDAFADLEPRYLWIWPYDSGGCGCEKCSPWGTNGFPRMAEAIARLARRKLPGVRVILSTWYLTPGEWNGLKEQFREKPDWVDFVLAEHLTGGGNAARLMREGAPGGFPFVGFPEISMTGMQPYGGYGANPRPSADERQWRERADLLEGGFPYSEGVYEDISKALFAQFYWQADRPADETLREYAAYEFGPETVEDVLAAIRILEGNHARGAIGESADEAWRLVRRAEAKMSPRARQCWRWRVLYLRASIDREMRRTGGNLTGETLGAAFGELTRIYHAENALEDWLKPPSVTTTLPRKP